jgi:polyhydroxyalkanoate synthesis repressor PhaR
MPTIKRYTNRKLYNTQTRRYVNLEEIAGMVQNGEEVHVVDHKSGADLTAATLLQIILDLEKRIGDYVPNSILARMIQTSNTAFSHLRETLNPTNHLSHETINLEINRRMTILKDEDIISPKEFDKLIAHLTDPRFAQSPNNRKADENAENFIPLEELHNLINQVRDLETRLQSIQLHN